MKGHFRVLFQVILQTSLILGITNCISICFLVRCPNSQSQVQLFFSFDDALPAAVVEMVPSWFMSMIMIAYLWMMICNSIQFLPIHIISTTGYSSSLKIFIFIRKYIFSRVARDYIWQYFSTVWGCSCSLKWFDGNP